MNANEKLGYIIGQYYPYILFFILMLFLHFFMGFINDDIDFSKALIDYSFKDYLIYRYNGWSSRLVIESVLCVLTRENMFIWKILDPFIFTAGVYYSIKFINSKYKNIAFLGVLLFLMYPFTDMNTAGWMSTTLNYLWCFSLGLISFIPLMNKLHDEKTHWIWYIISVLGLIYAANQEQCCALIFGLNVVYLIYSFINKEKFSKYNLLALVISAASLLFIAQCPGNAIRVVNETIRWYPDFAGFGLLHKIYLGTIPTMGIFLQNKIIFTIFYIILNICALFKTENKYLKYILYFNILFILSITVFMPLLINVFPWIGDSLNVFSLVVIPPKNKATAIAIWIAVYLLLSSFLILVKSFGIKNLFPAVLFVAGFMSRFIVGFSPTIFASLSRTALFFYMILIILSLMLINKLYDEDRINQKQEVIINAVFILIAVFNYINVFISI